MVFKSYKGEVKKMELMKIPGMKRPVRVAEWKDAKHTVKKILKEERKYLSIMSNL